MTTTSLMNVLDLYRREYAEAAAQARRSLGLNELDAKVITFVAENPGSRPSDLREHLQVTSGGVTAIVERLVQREILRREYDPSDRRVNRIHVVVDLNEAPWSDLTRFERRCADAIAELGEETETAVAETLSRIVLAARG